MPEKLSRDGKKSQEFYMKLKKINSLLVILTVVSMVGCIRQATNQRSTSNGITTDDSSVGTIGGGNNSGSGGSGSVTNCSDGVSRTDATRCYYSLGPLTFNGSGQSGFRYWQSNTDLSSDFTQDIFRTDMNFRVRIKPVIADSTYSAQGRRCSQFTKNNWNRLQVKLMLSKTSDSGLSTNIKTFTAKVGEFSEAQSFIVPTGATGPLVLSVHSFMSDHRCFHDGSKYVYGSLPASDLTRCKNGTTFYDIPLVTSTANPTECIAFQIDFATDTTYDLP